MANGIKQWPLSHHRESGHFTGPSVGPTDALLYWLYYFLQSGRLQASVAARPHLVFIRDTRFTELM
jgi:hypothetical protein